MSVGPAYYKERPELKPEYCLWCFNTNGRGCSGCRIAIHSSQPGDFIKPCACHCNDDYKAERFREYVTVKHTQSVESPCDEGCCLEYPCAKCHEKDDRRNGLYTFQCCGGNDDRPDSKDVANRGPKAHTMDCDYFPGVVPTECKHEFHRCLKCGFDALPVSNKQKESK